jgi:triosephosphate isomerase (TIM)
MTKKIVGNWKMHGDTAMAQSLTRAVAEACASLPPAVEVVLCPPAVLIEMVARQLKSAASAVKTGGQDCHKEAQGAFTGDISAAMLRDAGCSHVILGHSERRLYHHEKNGDVRQKAASAIAAGLTPIICIGESQQERDSGRAQEIVGQQVEASLPDEARLEGDSGNFVLAYEPVWAIGSGKIPSADDIRAMHSYIISVASRRIGLAQDKVHVLYGGSVKPDNAREILQIEGVSGVLVGGASVKADEFCRIIHSAVA